MAEEHGHVVVIGASAGGVHALSTLVSGLPPGLAAPILIVQHVSAGHESVLPEILSRTGPLKASHAIHGEPLQVGRIYVAPPDNHLMVLPGYLHVARGPMENGFRPAVDALFRSAAIAYESAAIGVILTGSLDCGTAGLLSIKARGGRAIVQDPSEAKEPSMPQSAVDHVDVDYVVPLAEIAPLIVELVGRPIPERVKTPLSDSILQMEGASLGLAAELVCPACEGRMSWSSVGGFEMFRCHVGHTFSLESVVRAQFLETERALWAAARALEESAALGLRVADRVGRPGRNRIEEKANTQLRHARIIHQLIERGAGSQMDSQTPEASQPN